MSAESQARIEKIWNQVRQIPAGTVASYGQVAQLCGLGRGARLVGYALKRLPKNSDVPWHRVLNSAGKISLPEDSPSFAEQRRRLQDEGVVVLGARVRMREFQWQPDMDELLWKPPGL